MLTSAAKIDDDGIALDKFLQGMEIPPQPQVLRKVMAEQQKANPDLHKVADAVSQDVGLSAAMLRAANSPAFGLRSQVTSISQAVLLLGMPNAVSLVTGLSLRMSMKGKSKVNLDDFWNTAADTAIVTAMLARRLSLMSPDQAHMLGLFHDCGIPLLMQKFPNYTEVAKQARSSPDESITTLEDRHFSTNHAVVAYYVAKSWFLPKDIREVILHHHNESLLTRDEGKLSSQVAMLLCAEHLSHSFRHMASEDRGWDRQEEQVLALLGLTQEDCEDVNADIVNVLK
ncbi:HDOD domain-containing protein [Gammaproteobacteria bacterium]